MNYTCHFLSGSSLNLFFSRCCRHHDLGCPLSIPPGETRYSLYNSRYHTVMHCRCDYRQHGEKTNSSKLIFFSRFHSCLKSAQTQIADITGNVFFNIGNTHCFEFEQNEVKQKIFLGLLIFLFQICTSYSWWGQCRKKKKKPQAVWRKPRRY